MFVLPANCFASSLNCRAANYWYSGFIRLQSLIDATIIQVRDPPPAHRSAQSEEGVPHPAQRVPHPSPGVPHSVQSEEGVPHPAQGVPHLAQRVPHPAQYSRGYPTQHKLRRGYPTQGIGPCPPMRVLICPCPYMSLSLYVHVLICPCPYTIMSLYAHVLICPCPYMSLSLYVHVLICPCPSPCPSASCRPSARC